jgi:hypothetical protein
MRNIPAMKLNKKPTMAVPLFMTNSSYELFSLLKFDAWVAAGSGAMPCEDPDSGKCLAGFSPARWRRTDRSAHAGAAKSGSASAS